MNIFFKILCSILLIPTFLITIISGSVKFNILNDKFWINTFQRHAVYQNLQTETKKYLIEKNASTFLVLVTTDNIKDFTNKNISHVTKFLNGNQKDLSFYIPVSKIPKEMLPKKLGTLKEEMSARDLIQKFNISGIDPIIFDQFKVTGKVINYIFYISLSLSIFLSIFVFPELLTIFGILLFIQALFISNINLGVNKIVQITLTPMIFEISKSWQVVGICLVIISIIIILVKKFARIKHG